MNTPRVLVFFQHNPYPPTTGAHQRCLAVLRALRNTGCEVVLFSSSLVTNTVWTEPSRRRFEKDYGIRVKLYKPTRADERYVKDFWTLGRQTFWGRFAPPGLARAFAAFARQFDPDVAIVNYSYFGALIDDPVFRKKLTILETLDLYSLSEQMQDILREQFRPAPFDPNHAPAFLLDERLFKDLRLDAWPEEYAMCDRFDVSVVVSPAETESVRSRAAHTRAVRIPITAEAQEIGNAYSGAPLFVAALNMMNAQGYLYFVRRVLPLIHASCPSFLLDVAGSINNHFPPTIGIRPMGYVERLSDLYRDAPFTICPMLGATGQQIKVVESMALGVPVVVHENVADSSPVIDGVNGFVARTPEQFAARCLRLHADRSLCRRMGEAARKTIRDDWSPARLEDGFREILSQGKRLRPRPAPAKRTKKSDSPPPAGRFTIVVDATDASSESIEATLASLCHPRTELLDVAVIGAKGKRLTHRKSIRFAPSVRAAVADAAGDFCAMLRAGDRLPPRAFDHVAAAFLSNKQLLWLQGRPAFCDERGEIVWIMKDPPEMPDTLSLWPRRACIFWRHNARLRFGADRLSPAAYADFTTHLLRGRGQVATLEALLGLACTGLEPSGPPPVHKQLRESATILTVSREASIEVLQAIRSLEHKEQLDHLRRLDTETVRTRRALRKLFCAATEQLILERWRHLASDKDTPARVALYGAGAHTRWLLKTVRRKPGPQIVAVLDDNAQPGQTVGRLPVCHPADFDPATVSAIVLSTDTLTDTFAGRCRRLYGRNVRLVELYRGLPPGPYPKD